MTENFTEAQANVIVKAWKDRVFKSRLLKNPEEVLKEMGLEVPADFQGVTQEEKQEGVYFYLPPEPADIENVTKRDIKESLDSCTWTCFPITS